MNVYCDTCTHLQSAQLFRTYRGWDKAPRDNESEYAFKSSSVSQSLPERSTKFPHSWSTTQILERHHRSCKDSTASIFIHKNLSQILASVKSCHLCALIYEYIVLPRQGEPKFLIDQYDKSYLIPFFSIRYDAKGGADGIKSLGFSACAEDSVTRPLGTLFQIPLRSSPVQPTSSGLVAEVETCSNFRVLETTLQRIRSWLERCRNQHTDCAKWAQLDVKAPKRLLHISQGLDANSPKIKLIETSHEASEVGESFRWVSLSHCWGDGVSLTLSKTRYANWLKDIPLATLPRSFREAAVVTLQLGLRYLWIDALCIIQDKDSDDFMEQAPLMRSIYGGSVVTIAATASVDGNGGLFVQNHLATPCTLQFCCSGDTSLTGSYGAGPSASDLHFVDIENAKLNTRGWVFQERFLSPRSIHFARNEVWWNCLEHIDKETHDPSDPVTDRSVISELLADTATGKGYLGDHTWEMLIERYSKLDFSYVGKDRLIALAGIAEVLSKHRGHSPRDYAAGLWQSDFKSHLLWGTYCSERFPSQALRSVAPSWSWASYSGPVTFWHATPETSWNPKLAVLDVSVQTWDTAPFSAVTGGYVRLASPVLVVQNIRQFGVSVQASSGEIYSAGDSSATTGNIDWFEGWDLDKTSFGQADATHLLPLCYDRNSEMLRRKAWFNEVTELDQCFAVMLLKAIPEEKGTYMRVGLRAYIWQQVPSWWFHGSQLDSSHYLNNYGEGVYEIRMV